MPSPILEVSGCQHVAQQPQEPVVVDLLRQDRDQLEKACARARALVESINSGVRPRAYLNAALLRVETLAVAGRDDAALTALIPLAEQCARLGLLRPILDAGPATTRLAKALRVDHLRRYEDTAGLEKYLSDLAKQPS